jgi:hypothetical protein
MLIMFYLFKFFVEIVVSYGKEEKNKRVELLSGGKGL